MEENDKALFAGVINELAACWAVQVTKPLLAAYWAGLKDLPFASVRMAADRALSTCKRMPVPRELRDLGGEEGVEGRAIRAWNQVLRAIRGVGAHLSVDLGPEANATIRALGGWPRLCSQDSEELHRWTSKEFQRVYRELCASPVPPESGRYLPGLSEIDNRASGHDAWVAEPRRLGAPERRMIEGRAAPLLSEKED